jgi:hypothetical protein
VLSVIQQFQDKLITWIDRLRFGLRLRLASRVATSFQGVENVRRRPERLRAVPGFTKYVALIKCVLSCRSCYKRLFLCQQCRNRGYCKPTSGSVVFGLEMTCSMLSAPWNGPICRILLRGLDRVAWAEAQPGKSRLHRHRLPRRW